MIPLVSQSQTTARILLLAGFVCLVCSDQRIAASSVTWPQMHSISIASILQDDVPVYKAYKGVAVGEAFDNVRKKLGKPRDEFDGLDIYQFSDTEMATVYYDEAQKVTAVSVDYKGDGDGVPLPKDVLGVDIKPNPDGSKHRLVRYPKAGFWVSYSRTASKLPTITITIQKM